MSLNNHWILPEGFQEILPPHSNRLEHCRNLIINTFNQYSYDIVHPPMLEYLDSLTAGHGKYLELSTFKVTDQKSGRMLGLRADITPQISRINAHYMSEKSVTRLSYMGQILQTGRNNADTNREQMQFGAELYGSASRYAEFEVIQLSLQTLSVLEINDLRLTIGNMGLINHFVDLMFSEGLLSDVQQSHSEKSLELFVSHQQAEFLDILKRRSKPDAEKFLTQCIPNKKWLAFWPQYLSLIGVPNDVFSKLNDLCTQLDITVPTSYSDLTELVQLVADEYPDVILQVDMGLLHHYDYHTGLIFYIYSPLANTPIVKGGRYDGVDDFGAPLPAIGFSADLYQLLSMTSASSQETKGQVVKAILPNFDKDNDTTKEIFISFQQALKHYRHKGHNVEVILPEQAADKDGKQKYTHQLCYIDGHWQLNSVK